MTDKKQNKTNVLHMVALDKKSKLHHVVTKNSCEEIWCQVVAQYFKQVFTPVHVSCDSFTWGNCQVTLSITTA